MSSDSLQANCKHWTSERCDNSHLSCLQRKDWVSSQIFSSPMVTHLNSRHCSASMHTTRHQVQFKQPHPVSLIRTILGTLTELYGIKYGVNGKGNVTGAAKAHTPCLQTREASSAVIHCLPKHYECFRGKSTWSRTLSVLDMMNGVGTCRESAVVLLLFW